MQRESRHEIYAFLIIALTAFLFICLITQDPRDVLDPGPAVQNACGPLGAHVAFHLTSWLGTFAAHGLAALLGLAGVALLFRHRVDEWYWKLLGSALALWALACLEVAASHGEPASATMPGGFYGQYFYGLLLANLSSAGTYLLLGLVLLVAFIISTDTVFYPALARAGGAVLDAERWERAARGLQKSLHRLRLPSVTIPRPRLSWDWVREAAPAKPRKRAAGRRAETTEQEENAPVASEPVEETSSVEADGPAPREKEPRKGRKPAAEAEPDAGEAKTSAARASDDEEESDAGVEVIAAAAPAVPAATEPAKVDRPPLKIREAEPRPTTPKKRSPERANAGPYKLPPLELLDLPVQTVNPLDRTILEQTAGKIEETLRHFKIEARVVEVQKGPTITQYEVALAAGIKVHKIINLSDDLAMALKAPSIRIVAPIPGKSTVGVEVPNKSRSMVGLRELIEAQEFRDEDYKLPLAFGRDVAGSPVIADLGEMPHLLIAGSTGSGKSVCINSIIINLLLTRTPDEVKLILVDPKMVELAQFENIPHLLAPVVTDMKKAPAVLGWLVDKMEERYELFAVSGVRHITAYNALGKEKLKERLEGKVDAADIDDFPERLPFYVIIIDELADLMMVSSKEVEASITRLSQKSRAVGIHVILATQRPSVDVITGLIKANMPSRVSFHVASKVDSRTILDRNGAEKLLGKGDMLYLPPGTSALQRVQGTFISDKEIRDVVKSAVQQAEPQFSPELTIFGADAGGDGNQEDELYEQAVRIVLGSQRGSVTLLQRQLQIGYTRASRLMEIMHEHGLVGPFKGSKAREVYYTLEEWEQANAKRQPQAEDTGEGGGPGDEGAPGEHDQPGMSEEHS